MEPQAFSYSSRKLGRFTGLLYFLIILGGLFGGMVVRGSIVVPDNPEGTLVNMVAQEDLYRLGFLGDLVMVLCDVGISVLFYFLLREVHQGIALLAMVFRLIQSAVLGANLINLYTPLILIQNVSGMSPPEHQELAVEVSRQLTVFDYGYLISGVFFAINCLLMGYLLYHSELFPRLLGWMIGLAGLGYMFNSLSSFALPALVELSETVMFFTAVIAELALMLYLLIKGTRVDRGVEW